MTEDIKLLNAALDDSPEDFHTMLVLADAMEESGGDEWLIEAYRWCGENEVAIHKNRCRKINGEIGEVFYIGRPHPSNIMKSEEEEKVARIHATLYLISFNSRQEAMAMLADTMESNVARKQYWDQHRR